MMPWRMALSVMVLTASIAWAADKTAQTTSQPAASRKDAKTAASGGGEWQHGLIPYSDVPVPEKAAGEAKTLAPSGDRAWQVGLSDWGAATKPATPPAAASTAPKKPPDEKLKVRSLVSGHPSSTKAAATPTPQQRLTKPAPTNVKTAAQIKSLRSEERSSPSR